MSRITIYGLTKEGYLLAKTLSKKGYKINIIDEKLQIGLDIKEELINKYDEVEELAKSEIPIGFKSVGDIFKETDYLFFTPKMKEGGEGVYSDVTIKIKEIIGYLHKGISLINCIPLPLGKNLELIEIIEKSGGIRIKEDFNYFYFPLLPLKNYSFLIGVYDLNGSKGTFDVITSLIKKPLISNITSSEILYFKEVINHYFKLIPEVEFQLRREEILNEEFKDIYLDELVEFLFDLKTLSLNLRAPDPLYYTSTAILKALDLYVKNLIDNIKKLIKLKELRLSKVKVFLSWMMNDYEIRGERKHFLSYLVNKFKDYIGETYPLNKEEIKKGFLPSEIFERFKVIVACSQEDLRLWKNNKKENSILIKANQFFDVV
ncbi:hypothetical protein HRbin06_00939 [archaeon HR06]|nr:hypothetical protein HRbin06_00939 [archaeon HR06]